MSPRKTKMSSKKYKHWKGHIPSPRKVLRKIRKDVETHTRKT